MKHLVRIALSAIVVAAATAASAAPFDSADQARREQNRQEVLEKHGVTPAAYRSGDYRSMDDAPARPTLRDRTHRAAEATRNGTHRAAEATRNLGHRTADKMRDIGDKTNARFDNKKGSPSKDPYQHGPQ